VPLYDTVIANGILVLPHRGLVKAHVGTKDGKIRFLGLEDPSGDAREVIDAGGKYVFPGLLDPHVHFGNYLPFFQDFKTETRSAAAGGVTCILTQLKIGLFSDEFEPYFAVFDRVQKDLQGVSSVDYSFHFHIPHEKYADEIPSYYEQLGIQSYKFHMVYKPRDIQDDVTHIRKMSPGMDDGAIYTVLRKVGRLDPSPLMTVHCEVDDLIIHTMKEAKEAGLSGLSGWDAARPDIAEELGISRLAAMARYTGAHVYVVHLTSRKGLDVIQEEKAKKTHIWVETCPHFLWLTKEEKGTLAKIAPPLRSGEDVESLWEAIRDGTIDCIGTDHGPKYKKTKVDNIWEASLAFPGLETMLPLIITGAIKRGIPLERVAEICSYNTALAFGLYPKKGNIAVGSDADMVIVDMEEERRIDPANLYSEADFTPFEGMEVRGWPLITLLRGKRIFDRGRFPNEGIGTFIPRYPR
jgi:dihydropyrimidinase